MFQYQTSSTTSTATPTPHPFEKRVPGVKVSKEYVPLEQTPDRTHGGFMMYYNQVGNLS